MIYALRESYEKELMHLNRFISPGMVVVDGGASCGIYTIAAAKLVGPTGVVLSFEPGGEAFSILKKNIDLNRLGNVRAYHAALSDKVGKAPLYHHSHGQNSFSLGPPDASASKYEQVTTLPLSRVLHEKTADRIGFIKLDVEGAEELVLHGAVEAIARSHPTIVFEMQGAAAKRLGRSPVGAWSLLGKLGYNFFSLTESGNLNELHRPPAEDDTVNVIAIHSRQYK
jgi:FkbM family methyltransferase